LKEKIKDQRKPSFPSKRIIKEQENMLALEKNLRRIGERKRERSWEKRERRREILAKMKREKRIRVMRYFFPKTI
jgi:hypothetical protein